MDRLGGLMVRVLGYRSGGPGSIPGTTRKKVVGLERGPLSLVSTNWGATWYKSSGFCLENREYGRRDPSRWPRGTLYPQKFAITSPTSGGRSVGIVRSRTQTMEFVLVLSLINVVLSRWWDDWACLWHASTLIRGQLFLSSSGSFVSFLLM
jgi:hypothetical protein